MKKFQVSVKKGQTLSDIATASGMTVDELKKINNLSSDKIKENDKIMVTSDLDSDEFSKRYNDYYKAKHDNNLKKWESEYGEKYREQEKVKNFWSGNESRFEMPNDLKGFDTINDEDSKRMLDNYKRQTGNNNPNIHIAKSQDGRYAIVNENGKTLALKQDNTTDTWVTKNLDENKHTINSQVANKEKEKLNSVNEYANKKYLGSDGTTYSFNYTDFENWKRQSNNPNATQDDYFKMKEREHKGAESTKDIALNAARGVVGATAGLSMAPTVASLGSDFGKTKVGNFLYNTLKYQAQHPIESFVAPEVTRFGVNKGFDVYEDLSGNQISDRVRNNTTNVLNMTALPAAANTGRRMLSNHFATNIDAGMGMAKRYFRNAISNQGNGVTQVGSVGSNFIRGMTPAAIGSGVYLGVDQALDGRQLGGYLNEEYGVNPYLAQGIEMGTNSAIYGISNRLGNRPASQVISNANQLAMGAPSAATAVNNWSRAPLSEFGVSGRPARVQVGTTWSKARTALPKADKSLTKEQKIAFKAEQDKQLLAMYGPEQPIYESYQQNYDISKAQMGNKQHRKTMPWYTVRGTAEDLNNRAIYYNTTAGNTFKVGDEIGAGHVVRGMSTRGSKTDSDDFMLRTGHDVVGTADRWGKGQQAILVERPGSVKLPSFNQMQKEGWVGLERDAHGILRASPIHKDFKPKMTGAREDWVTTNADGSGTAFNANGYQSTMLRSPDGKTYHLKFDVGGTGSAGNKFISGIADSGMTPMVTYEVTPTTTNSFHIKTGKKKPNSKNPIDEDKYETKTAGAFNRAATFNPPSPKKFNLLKQLFSKKARDEHKELNNNYKNSEEGKKHKDRLRKDALNQTKVLQNDADVISSPVRDLNDFRGYYKNGGRFKYLKWS